ncbi:2106_t:CDS:2, partial [Entrophospora sp. SA101]
LNNVIAAEPVYATRSLLCDVLLLKKINDDSYMLELWIGCGEYVLLQLDYHLNTILKLNSNSSKIKNLNSTSILNHSEINNCVDSLANTNINSVIDPSIENFVYFVLSKKKEDNLKNVFSSSTSSLPPLLSILLLAIISPSI